MAFEDADGNKRREFNDRNYASLWIRPLIFCACSLVAAGLLLGVSFMAPAKAWLAEVKLSAPVNGESAMRVRLGVFGQCTREGEGGVWTCPAGVRIGLPSGLLLAPLVYNQD